ncbi:MAG: S-methyl-5-thioribose-1-phosphate isomerase [Alphaproteobacteria bacterium]|nr:S-methyl-5-thioribose-1-phosphate isomerase [Alphaproteobacteria bacterium]
MNIDGVPYRTVWLDGSTVKLIDQPLLPHTFAIHDAPTPAATADAIRTMVVRGAGAIGATGAFGIAQAALLARDADFHAEVAQAASLLAATRPTAQNLFYGIRAVMHAIEAQGDDLSAARQAAVAAAQEVADDDAACCEAIGRHGAPLLEDGMGVGTHCNAGWLAFVDWGSALSPIYAAHRGGTRLHVWVDETRPRSQGARLTAFELGQEGVPHSVIADNSMGAWMRRGQVQAVIVGSDRIAANGDVANKIGTYAVATMAAANGIPFYVAAPTTTIDPDCPHGDDIPIEERGEDEVAWTWGWSDEGRFLRVRTTPAHSRCRNLAFDVTPAALVRGILTEHGLVPASPEGMARVMRRPGPPQG